MGDDEWVKKNFLSECDHIVSNLKNHPCIVTWIAFNEGFGQYADNSNHTRNAYNRIKALDDTRIVSSASGWVIFDNVGQVADMHSYASQSYFQPDICMWRIWWNHLCYKRPCLEKQ